MHGSQQLQILSIAVDMNILKFNDDCINSKMITL